MTKIIAFSGYAGTGKNTFANELTTQLATKYKVGEFMLAGPGKAAVAEAMNLDISDMEDKEFRVKKCIGLTGSEPISPLDAIRIILETVASNGYPTLWADLLMQKLILNDDLDYAIITDLRRTRELEVFRRITDKMVYRDFYHFHVVRDMELTDYHNHVSESEVENLRALADKVIDLDGNIPSLVTDAISFTQ